MDISKILEMGKNYIADYVNMILTVFTNPQFLHEETVKNYNEKTPSSLLIIPSQINISNSLKKFPPQILINVFISIFIGSILNKLNPSLNASADLINWIILVTLFWIMYLLIAFTFFKLLKGKLKLLDFLAVCLQIIASAYIVSSFLSLFSSIFLNNFILLSMQLPMIVYTGIQSLLLLILIPVSLSKFIG